MNRFAAILATILVLTPDGFDGGVVASIDRSRIPCGNIGAGACFSAVSGFGGVWIP
jgi:hypothetical protein